MARTIGELVVIKDGSAINGEVLVKEFVLKLKYGTLTLAKSDMLSVEYQHPPYPDDQVQVSAGTKLHGDLTPAVFDVRVENTSQVLTVPKTDVHTLVFFTGDGKVSAPTRKALKSVR